MAIIRFEILVMLFSIILVGCSSSNNPSGQDCVDDNTCNYDGIKKNKTKIEDNVFVGSNVSLVAPIKLSKNSMVGAGSVITESVKENVLAVERNLQQTFPNYKKSRKK